ncbi:DUF2301 domain-containing membrane protein [Synechococcus sp. UW140]|uniref:DUF2301 domain-containing membrane protein n=1 Tax=Synechococcus sp. UW140 TaxID=368503 RepID=UPI0031380CC9
MTSAPATYQGVYGPYTVTAQHRQEVLFYRLSLLLLALAQAGLLIQWRQWGPGFCWPWLLLMGLGLGAALRWVHIYVRPLHRSLQLFWLLGCLGAAVLAWRVGPAAILPTLVAQPLWIWAVGPFFAALAGLGFKEFFCFQRPEAIGLTLLLPLLLLGWLAGVLSAPIAAALLGLESLLLLLLALRKFPMAPEADLGDLSVFAHLDAHRA